MAFYEQRGITTSLSAVSFFVRLRRLFRLFLAAIYFAVPFFRPRNVIEAKAIGFLCGNRVRAGEKNGTPDEE